MHYDETKKSAHDSQIVKPQVMQLLDWLQSSKHISINKLSVHILVALVF